MNEPQQFSDEQLTAYLDGEDGLAPREEIERGLAQDAQQRAQLDSLRLDKEAVRAAFDSLLADAPPAQEWRQSSFAATPDRRYRQSWRHAAAAAALALVIGFGGGAVLTRQADPGWRDYVAAYHALYTTGTLSHINQSISAAAAELERVSTAIEKPIRMEDVSIPDQLDYKRAQVLSFEGRRIVQLAFLSKQGAPVALCIIEAPQARDVAVETTEMEGMSAAIWSKGAHEFVLIGGADSALIRQLAAVYSERL